MAWEVSLEKISSKPKSILMATAYFTNAPREVVFVGGDPETLRKVQTVELSVGGDRGLADRLNNSLLKRKSGIYGFPVEEKVLKLGERELAARD